MKSIKTTTALAAVLTLSPAVAMAAAGGSFGEADADGNAELSAAEFEEVSRGAFAAWDENQDDRLTADELYKGVFAAWDKDDNDELTEDEYRQGYTAWFEGSVEPSFSEVAGDDEVVGQDEFASALRDSDALSGFDVGEDGFEWDAFHTALFVIYDKDADDALAEDEYAAYEDTQATEAGSNGEDVVATEQRTSNREETAATGEADVAPDEQTSAIGQDAVEAEVIALPNWRTENLYADGISIEYLMDEVEVYGPGGDEIGSIENVVFSQDGKILSVVAEVGGFWDMFDTHVNVPWSEVEYSDARITIPVTEENVEDYSVFRTGYLTASEAERNTEVIDDDLATGPRAFRASELIGDYARIRNQDRDYVNYGYVNDLIVREGELAAVVVRPDAGYGTAGPYAYPYYNYGWAPGTPYYDMPYGEQDVADAEQLDYDRFDY